MDKVELKTSLHNIIDRIDNIDLLKEYYHEMKKLLKRTESNIWGTLTDEQKKEVLLSFEESENDENLVDHDKVMKNYKKWL